MDKTEVCDYCYSILPNHYPQSECLVELVERLRKLLGIDPDSVWCVKCQCYDCANCGKN